MSNKNNQVTLSYKILTELKVFNKPIVISLETIQRENTLLKGTISSQESFHLKELVNAFQDNLGDVIPADITITLNQLLFIFKQQDKGTQYLVILNLGTEINLSNLPLIGKKFSPNQTIAIKDFIFLYASNEFKNISAISELPQKDIVKGLGLLASMDFGGQITPLNVPIPQKDSPTLSASGGDTNDLTTSDGTKWFDLKKNFGPVYFQRVGVKYQNSEVWFLLDASISSAGLTLTLDGLSVGSSIKQFKPKFNLQGLGISYESKGGVSIGGSFLRSTNSNGKDEYSGALIVKTEAFTLTAIGSYTTTEEGHPSLFIYGILDKAIGGPPFFFITGLALGFGYNRSLILPTLDQIPNFSLVKAALNSGKADLAGLKAIQKELTPYIPPKTGEIFLAVGIKFTSFKIIDSFALFVATFGDQFTLNLIGISTLISPPALVENQPLAKVRFALLARFVPAEGTLKVDGKILPDSYIFDKKCTISGGFAFYSWFKGPDEGDFVLTVGGYHPKFDIPPHYPRVDPLALNWQISSELSVKGSVYFALTASAIMAGGRLEAVWESGNKKAWFIANAHFIVAWQPYFYEAKISLRMGASYTFKIVSVRKTISVDLGASLHIWGPEFSGTATIDLQIISFTIAFGSRTRQKPVPLTWTDFKKSFLPEQVCTIGIESGLLRKVGDGESAIFIVNPKEFVIATSSVIPIKTANIFCFSITESEDLSSIKTELNENHISDNLKNKFKNNNKSLSSASLEKIQKNESWTITDDINQYFLCIEKDINNEDLLNLNIYTKENLNTKDKSNSFGIAPMNVNTSNFTQSRYNITITNYEKFSFEPIYKNIPAGLWGESTEVNINGKLIKNVLSGFKIKPANPAKPGETKAIERSKLAYDIESVDSAYQWQSFSNFSESVEQNENTRQENIAKSIINDNVINKRNSLLQSLRLSDNDIDLDEFKTKKGKEQAFIISPCLQLSI